MASTRWNLVPIPSKATAPMQTRPNPLGDTYPPIDSNCRCEVLLLENVLQFQDSSGNWVDAGECPVHGRLPGAVVAPRGRCNGQSVNCPCND